MKPFLSIGIFVRTEHLIKGGVVNLYKNQGNLHIHDSGKKEIQIKREKIYTNSNGCRDIHFGK